MYLSGRYTVSRFGRTTVASPEASWFETREDALLTTRSDMSPHPEEHRKAMRLEG
jgi:hypothetical protein